MKNREKLMNQSLYDTILSAQKELDRIQDSGQPFCVLNIICGEHTPKCTGSCDGCIASWLNEEA